MIRIDNKFLDRADEILCTVKRGEKITAALSGGADSVFLLYLLASYCDDNGTLLEAVHVNHSLRGEESDRDEMFCRELCKENNIPLTVKRIDAKKYSEENHLSVEEGARKLRYDIFGRIEGYTATAHNLNDNAETVILNMARGTALKGLCGIPPKRDNIIRPLLKISRQEIEDFLNRNGIPFVTDSTNLSDAYTRNRIRHNILPVMESVNENYLLNIGRMTGFLSEDEELLSRMAENLSSDIGELKNAHPALRKRFLKNKMSEAGISVNSDRISRAEKVIFKGNKEQLQENIFAYVENGKLHIDKMTYPHEPLRERKPLLIGENKFSDGKVIILEKVSFQKINSVNNSLTYFVLDYDKIQGGLFFRTVCEGDKIRLHGEKFHRKIRKILNAEKIPVYKRKEAVVIEDENEILFAEYCGVCDTVFSYDENGNLYRASIKYM